MPHPSAHIELDPSSGALPAPLMPHGFSGEPWIALLADAEMGRWGAEAAVAMARGWAIRPLLLVDGDLRHPVLHRILKVGEEEGVTDALRFGASPARIVHPVSGERFRLVTAGTAVGDPEALWEDSAAWGAWIRTLQEAEPGASVIVFLPSEAATAAEGASFKYRLGRGGVNRGDALPLIHPPGLGAPALAPEPATDPATDPATEPATEPAPGPAAPDSALQDEGAPVAPPSRGSHKGGPDQNAPADEGAQPAVPSPTPQKPDSADPRARRTRSASVVAPGKIRRGTTIFFLLGLFLLLAVLMVVGAQAFGYIEIPGLEFIPLVPAG
jgi:hypothetical protein